MAYCKRRVTDMVQQPSYTVVCKPFSRRCGFSHISPANHTKYSVFYEVLCFPTRNPPGLANACGCLADTYLNIEEFPVITTPNMNTYLLQPGRALPHTTRPGSVFNAFAQRWNKSGKWRFPSWLRGGSVWKGTWTAGSKQMCFFYDVEYSLCKKMK